MNTLRDPRTGAVTAHEFVLTPAERVYVAASVAGTAIGAYHGYKRTGSVGWALGWALVGGLFPIVTIPIALAQGLGTPEKKI